MTKHCKWGLIQPKQKKQQQQKNNFNQTMTSDHVRNYNTRDAPGGKTARRSHNEWRVNISGQNQNHESHSVFTIQFTWQ